MNLFSKIKQYDSTTLALFSTGFFLFLYVAVRAWLVPITWDEDFTLNEYILKNKIFPLEYEMMSANNHLLNTWLIWLLSKAFGTGLLIIRLPNLVSYVFFLFLSAKIIKEIKPKDLQIVAFLIININPFMIDFFSLARGYGISLSLFMGSIYYLYRSFHHVKGNYIYAWLTACIGLLANLTLFYYVAALFFVILVCKFLFKENLNFSSRKIIISITTIPLVFLVYHGIKLNASGSLYYGGHDGFWFNTVNSLVFKSLYDMSYSDFVQVPVKLLIFGVLALAVFITVKQTLLNKKIHFLSSLVFLLLFIISLVILANKLLGISFLIERTAIYFLPLFSLIIVFTFNHLTSVIKEKYVFLFSSIVAICFLIHFFYCINFHYALDWKQNGTA